MLVDTNVLIDVLQDEPEWADGRCNSCRYNPEFSASP